MMLSHQDAERFIQTAMTVGRELYFCIQTHPSTFVITQLQITVINSPSHYLDVISLFLSDMKLLKNKYMYYSL